MGRPDQALADHLDEMTIARLPGLMYWALVWILQEHLPYDTGVHEVHKVDQGSGYLKRRLQVRQGLPGFGQRLPLDFELSACLGSRDESVSDYFTEGCSPSTTQVSTSGRWGGVLHSHSIDGTSRKDNKC